MRFADRRERKTVKWRGPEAAKRFHVFWSGVAFVLGKSVAGIRRIVFREARVAMSFSEDGRSGDRDAASVPFDEGFLFDKYIELHGINQQIVRNDGKLL